MTKSGSGDWPEQENSLKKKPGMPLYVQIMENIDHLIESHEWTVGSMLPTEKELCNIYNVSKITVREALKLLVRDGKLRRVAGKGTFVTKPKLEQNLDRFFSFSKWAIQNNLESATRVLKVDIDQCDDHIAKHLSLKDEREVTRIERIRLGDNEPLMVEFIWVPTSICPNLYLQDLANVPLNDIVRNSYALPIIKATESIEAIFSDDYISRLLNIERESLLLSVEHTAFTHGSKSIYIARSFYRGDRVKFLIDLTEKGK